MSTTLSTPPVVEELKERPTYRKRARSLGTFKVIALVPILIFFLVLVAYPVGALIWMSFGDVRIVGGSFLWEFIGLDNYSLMMDDSTFGRSIRTTIIFTFFTVLFTVIFGTILALLTDRLVRTQQLVQNILILPAIVAPVVISVVWLLLLSPQIGLINKVLGAAGLPAQTLLGDRLGALIAIIVVDIWHWTPIVFLFVYTALRAADIEVLEAARVDGASPWQMTWLIRLPLVLPAILAVTAIRVIMGVKAFDEFYLLTFGGPGDATNVVSIYLRSVFFDRFAYGYGAALSTTVVMGVFLTLLAGVGLRGLLRRRSNV